MTITQDIKYIGVNDHQVDLFEGQYVVPNGMAYNSYAIMDEKIAIMDTVDKNFKHEWLDNIQKELGGRTPDYLVVQHMEPDHSANIDNFLKVYPDAVVVSSAKAFAMMKNFFGTEYEDRRIVVGEGDTLNLGKHVLTFVTAPMVHWPEVIVTYDSYDKVLFSADGFGKFGALDVEEDWACEARRYYIGIVGKYGPQVQAERPGEVIGSAGPTTSGRMDAYSPRLLDLGQSIMIGKGARNKAVQEAVVRNGAVYLAALGGAGALMAASVEELEVICWEDLGCEAVRRLQVKDFPLTVILDSHGGNLYESGPAAYLASK